MKPYIGSLDLKDLGAVHFKVQISTIYSLVIFCHSFAFFKKKVSPDNSSVLLVD